MLMSLPGALTDPIASDVRAWRTPFMYVLAALWVFLLTLIAVIEAAGYIHDPRAPYWQAVAIPLASAIVMGTWVTWVLRSDVYSQPALMPPARWFQFHFRRLPLLLAIWIASIYGIRHGVFYLGNARYVHLPWHGQLMFEAVKMSILYCLWLGLVFGVLSLAKWREESERMLRVQKALAEAQLAQLHAQLRPHFLFNALNTVSSLMHTDPARADRVLAQLADLLRASLAGNRGTEVTLKEEIALLKRYADIMSERFEERVTFEWQIAEDAGPARLPSMLLQPLLENAFKHGIERSAAAERIQVRAWHEAGELRIEVYNSGPALPADASSGSGVGLRNCRDRLALLYGAQAHLFVADDPRGGVMASVAMPWKA